MTPTRRVAAGRVSESVHGSLGLARSLRKRNKGACAGSKDSRPIRIVRFSFFSQSLVHARPAWIGAPRSVASAVAHSVKASPDAFQMTPLAAFNPITSHLPRLRTRPRFFASHSNLRTSFATPPASPPILISSRYPDTNSDLISVRRGLIARLKRSGPRGSPCWTP